MMAWLSANAVWILAAVVALDNGLAAIPAVQANSTFQLITKIVGQLSGFLKKPQA